MRLSRIAMRRVSDFHFVLSFFFYRQYHEFYPVIWLYFIAEITCLRAAILSSVARAFSLHADKKRRLNEWRTNMFSKLVSTVAIIRAYWDGTSAIVVRSGIPAPPWTFWRFSMERTNSRETDKRMSGHAFFSTVLLNIANRHLSSSLFYPYLYLCICWHSCP